MQKFRCLNEDCGKQSSVRTIDWYAGQHVTECEHCREWHVLEQIPTDEGAPLQFEVTGLLDV